MNKIYVGFIIVLVSVFFSCSQKTNSGSVTNTNLKSATISNKKDRIKILSKEIKMFSEIENAEFDLYNVNGFSDSPKSLPGASSSRYLIAVKVSPDNVSKWSNDLQEIKKEVEIPTWVADLIKTRNKDWSFSSKPKYYTRNGSANVEIIILQKEGIIFKRILQD